MIGEYNIGTAFPHNLLITNTQISKIHKAFANGSSANIKFSKAQQSKMLRLGGSFFRSVGISTAGPPKFIDPLVTPVRASYEEQLKNKTRKPNKGFGNLFVYTGLNIIGKNIKD